MGERERDDLLLAGEGLPNADITARLHVAERTVRNHLSTAITKLGVRNRIEAARVARDPAAVAPGAWRPRSVRFGRLYRYQLTHDRARCATSGRS